MSVIKNVKEELLSQDGPIVKKLHANDSFRAIILGFNSGTTFKDHKANWPSKLTIMEGSVEFLQEGNITVLEKYDTHDIEVGIIHAVRATSDSICLLTQSKPQV